MFLKIPFYFFSIIFLGSFFSSCISSKKIAYFQSNENEISTDIVPEVKYEVGDIISVYVSCVDPLLSEPFNQNEFFRQGAQMTSYENGVPVDAGYMIMSDSTINLPVLGEFKVVGMTKTELVTQLETELESYLEKPSVNIRLLNFKVTVLGEVEHPGTFNIPNERATILEALGIAKDLKITGKRENVLVIRHENGVKTEYRIDLTRKDIFQSPVYYLKQNDVIYVEPNKKSRYDGSLMHSAGGVIVSSVSLAISTFILILQISK